MLLPFMAAGPVRPSSEALSHGADRDPKFYAELLSGMDQEMARLQRLLEDLSHLHEQTLGGLELDLRPLELLQWLSETLSPWQQAALQKRLHWQLKLPAELPVIYADPLRLGQVIGNLVSNAIKFTATGSITLRVRCVAEQPGRLVVRFEIIDTGIGLSDEEQQRLFTAFEQADTSMTRKYGGTGLGLAISKRLVHLMGGDIGVESQPNAGSTFWFTACFDRVSTTAPSLSSNTQPVETRLKLRAPGVRILLAEDEPISQDVARSLLEEAGFNVDLAEDGEAALDLARHGKYDLILMDMQMPKINGVDATRKIRALPDYARTPILAVTANAFSEDRALCLAAGMNDHIAKPVESAVLYEKLLRWLPPAT